MNSDPRTPARAPSAEAVIPSSTAEGVTPRSLLDTLGWAVAGSIFLAVCAQIRIDLPYVPITGQTFGLLVLAMALGAERAGLAVLLYLVEGLVGLPVFAGGAAGVAAFAGRSVGFLLGFIPATFLVGILADRGVTRSFTGRLLAGSLGTIVVLACGVPWLAVLADLPLGAAFTIGVLPYVPGAIVKIVAAAVVVGALPQRLRSAR